MNSADIPGRPLVEPGLIHLLTQGNDFLPYFRFLHEEMRICGLRLRGQPVVVPTPVSRAPHGPALLVG